jgi:hypothetical protein
MIPRRRLKTSTDPRDYRDASVTPSEALAQVMAMTGGGAFLLEGLDDPHIHFRIVDEPKRRDRGMPEREPLELVALRC